MFIINIAEYVKSLAIMGYLFSSFAFLCIFLCIRKLVLHR